jgi:hypothetical protein
MIDKKSIGIWAKAINYNHYIYLMMLDKYRIKSTDGIVSAMKKQKVNIFEGMCYTMSNAIYVLCNKHEDLRLYRCKDFENNYHWFLMNERILGERYVENGKLIKDIGTPFIDPSSNQYDYKEVPPPTNKLTSRLLDGSYSTGECLEGYERMGQLTYQSYRIKTQNFIDELSDWIKEYETAQTEARDMKKPVDLTDFMQ